MDRSVVESALDTLRPALTADNFALRLGSIASDGTVQVVLAAEPGACLDCLVPADTLVAIIEAAIRAAGGAPARVDVVREGFGTVTGH